jgi:hypothetical protein
MDLTKIQSASIEVVGDQLQVDGRALPGITCNQVGGNRYQIVTQDGYTLATVPQHELSSWTQNFLKAASFAGSAFS